MSKIYKGYELIKELSNKKITSEMKIVPHYPSGDCTVEYFEYSYGFLEAHYKNGKSDNNVNICVFLDNNRFFEVFDKNEFDINQITEPEIIDADEVDDYSVVVNRMKVKELVKAVKSLDDRIQKIECKLKD